MPLLHRKPFVPNPAPLGLSLDDDVFYCPLTKEIFTDYDEFFERTILCNSLVWSCSITKRANMTYQEALEHENASRKKFQKFPKNLQKPVLFLVKLVCRSRIEELNDAIFSFVKKRYFIGEELEVKVKANKFETCRILDVFSAKSLSEAKEGVNGHANGGVSSEEEEDDKPLSKFVKPKALEPNEVSYQVKLAGTSFEPVRVVPWSALRRKFKREHCKIFLKTTCLQDPDLNRVYFVKDEIAKKLDLESTTWEDIFAGREPTFSGQSPKIKKTAERAEEKKVSEKKASMAKAKEELMLQKQAKAREDILLQEMKKQEREMKLELKRREAEEAKRLKQLATEQRKKDYRERIEKMREVKRRLAEYKKEWSKQRDDLECDDLKDIPPPREIVTRVPPHLFGDILSLLEFFHTFETLFDAKDEFPKGVSLDLLEKAVLDEDQDGPLCDFIFFFLSNLFRTHIEEEGESFYVLEAGDEELAAEANENPTTENLVAKATVAATWPSKYQGWPINKLELDSYTVSEVLRIYLLSSAARPPSDSRLWRSQQRGGYGGNDDTPLRLCLDRPELVQKLLTTSIFNFTPDEKIEILLCLSNHLLSYVAPRDFMEDMAEKLFTAQQDYREDKRSERKREKDFVTDRLKWKNAQAIMEREIKLKNQENMLKMDQNNLTEDNVCVEIKTESGKLSDDEDTVIKEQRLMSSEEQLEHLKMLDEEEKVAKEAWEFRKNKHLEEISQYQKFKSLPIGEDRFFRRYWHLHCIPGLIVEEYPDEYLTKDLLRVKVAQQGEPAWNWSSGVYPAAEVPNNLVDAQTNCTNIPATKLETGQPQQTIKFEPPLAQINGNSSETAADSAESTSINLKTNGAKLASKSSDTTFKPSTHITTQGKAARWFIYTSKDEIEGLISSLNKRGFRESKLHDTLLAKKDRIFCNLNKCPVNELCQRHREEDENKRRNKSEACRQAIELALRDQLLELESRIFEGTLGGIKDEDGYKWVQRVTHGGSYEEEFRKSLIKSVELLHTGAHYKQMNGNEVPDSRQDASKDCPPVIRFAVEPSEDAEQCMEEGKKVEEMEVEGADSCQPEKKDETVKDLSLALLQIERGIDRKYLKAPLGHAVDIARRKTRSKGPPEESPEEKEERKRESEQLLKNWEKSLISSTSISQVSLHLATLNKCIIWARSVLNASCRICRRKGDAEKMLLCDSCDRGHHMYCLRPALKSVPSGDWFCPECKPKKVHLMSPRKVRTTSYSQEASSEEDEDTENDETEEEEDEEDEEEEEGDNDDEEEESSDEEEENDEDETTPPRRELKYKIPRKPSTTTVTMRGRKSKNISPVASTSKARGRSAGRVDFGKSSVESSKRGRSQSERRQAQKRNAPNEDEGDHLTSSNRRRSTGAWKDLNACQRLLKELIQHKDSWPFLMPVSKKQVPDYYNIIKYPMDFSTIQNKFKNIIYTDPAEFISDVKLVFSNCVTYNMPRSVHAKAAVQLGNFFEKKMREYSLDQYKEGAVNPPSKKKKS